MGGFRGEISLLHPAPQPREWPDESPPAQETLHNTRGEGNESLEEGWGEVLGEGMMNSKPSLLQLLVQGNLHP